MRLIVLDSHASESLNAEPLYDKTEVSDVELNVVTTCTDGK